MVSARSVTRIGHRIRVNERVVHQPVFPQGCARREHVTSELHLAAAPTHHRPLTQHGPSTKYQARTKH